jgi:hypothetical protein
MQRLLVLMFLLVAAPAGAELTSSDEAGFTYKVFGHTEEGLNDIAPAVDGVIDEQLERLKKRLNWN